MSYLSKLEIGLKKEIPITLQTESSECGAACLIMIMSYHGYEADIFSIRKKYPISQQGITLNTLSKIANRCNLITRPLKLDLDELNKLKLPCILHWNLNHFVVLKKVSNKNITILDPAFGERTVDFSEVSKKFTGVALELWPNSDFEKKKEKRKLNIYKLFNEVRGLKKSLTQVLSLSLALEIFSLINPFFMQWVIDHAISSSDQNLLTTLAIGFALLMLISSLVSLLQSWTIMYISTNLNIQWKANIFHHLLNLPVEFFKKRHLGDIVSRFGSIDSIQKTLTATFITAILDGLMTIFTLGLMFLYSAQLAWVAIVTIIIYGLIRWISYPKLKEVSENQIIHSAKQNSYFMESMRGVATIKQFQKQDLRHSSWLNLFINQTNSGLASQKISLIINFINSSLFGLQNIIVIWLGASLVINGDFTVGVFMAFMAYKNQFSSRISSLIDKFVELKMLTLHGDRLSDIVLTEKEERLESNFLENNHANKIDIDTTIQIRSLKFRYSEDLPWIINDINLDINSKESIAIIGPTGCGKTTLMNLMLGNLKPESGDIKMGGQSLSRTDNNKLRSLASYVSQDDVLFTGSILENISFFDHSIDESWIEKCAKMASIHNDIMLMPMGYQTLVGDMGNTLSGGQKQRILLARALYRKPKILFLDEATSHLDIVKEREINEMVKSLNMTRIIIAHRAETIASVDRVVIIDKGTIIDDKKIR